MVAASKASSRKKSTGISPSPSSQQGLSSIRRSNRSGIADDTLSRYTSFLLLLLLAGIAFYGGLLSGLHAASNNASVRCPSGTDRISSQMNKKRGLSPEDKKKVEVAVKERVAAALEKQKKMSDIKNADKNAQLSTTGSQPRIPRQLRNLAAGLARTTVKEFLSEFDYGQAQYRSPDKSGAEALIFYRSTKSLPSERRDAVANDDGNGIPLLPVAEATKNCDGMNVIVTHAGRSRQCLALMENYESYHLQKWMRVPPEGAMNQALDPKQPLRHVSRGKDNRGMDHFLPPSADVIKAHWKRLAVYLDVVDDISAALKKVVAPIARNKAVVVMVCNFGQSALLANFVCSARAKGIDVGNVLVFATDEETREVAKGLGLTVFHDERLFKDLPREEANVYGDRTFTEMMYAKVLTVQLINHIEYDVLFQDVDIVWYKDPLGYFQDKDGPYYDFDMLFQDDGARSQRYAPFAANSGFYYVRHNPRTRYLFTSLLYSSDLVTSTRSHQEALCMLLTEHSSLYGLKVKTITSDEEFPGGATFHRQADIMRKIVSGKTTPYIFHMSWTKNKDNKVLFFEQMGTWYLNDKCKDDGALDQLKKGKEIENYDFRSDCCLTEPKITCHYRDKPSAIDCNHSPNIDANGKPFWPNGITAT